MCAKEVKRPQATPAKMAASGSYAPVASPQPSEPQPMRERLPGSGRSAFHQPLFQLQRRRNPQKLAGAASRAAPHRSPAPRSEPHQSQPQSSFKVPWDRTTCTSCSPASRRYPPLPQTPPQSRLRFLRRAPAQAATFAALSLLVAAVSQSRFRNGFGKSTFRCRNVAPPFAERGARRNNLPPCPIQYTKI